MHFSFRNWTSSSQKYSAPEEDYISVHIRVVGDFTRDFAKAVGCDFDRKEKGEAGGKVVAAGQPDELTTRGGVEIQTGNGTRRFPDARREDVPAIVAGLVSDGIDIFEVTVIRSTLEDAYLELVDPT